MNVLMIIGLGVLGLVFGSFVNAFVWRLHGQEELKAKKPKNLDKKLAELSILRGRSMCPHCRHTLAAKDLVPVLSWLALRGKCRYCHRPIAWQYPAVELGVAVMFVVSYFFWPLPLHGYGLTSFVLWLVFLVGFAILAVCDVRWFWLPDKVVWPLAALAFLQILAHALFYQGGEHVLVTAFWGVVIGSGFFYVLYLAGSALGREWIGDGDVKLGIVLGLLVGGPLPAILVLYFASILGTLVSLPFLLNKKMKRTSLVPFGPFLLAAAVIVQLFGTHITDWINRLIIG